MDTDSDLLSKKHFDLISIKLWKAGFQEKPVQTQKVREKTAQ